MHLRCYCTFSNSCPNLQQQRQGHLVSPRRRQLNVNKRRTTIYKGARRLATADVPKLSTTEHFHDTQPLILHISLLSLTFVQNNHLDLNLILARNNLAQSEANRQRLPSTIAFFLADNSRREDHSIQRCRKYQTGCQQQRTSHYYICYKSTSPLEVANPSNKTSLGTPDLSLEVLNKTQQLIDLGSPSKSPSPISKVIGDTPYVVQNDRYIIFLVTKNKDRQRSTYENMYIALMNLKQFCEENNLDKIAMNKLGMNDNLQLEKIWSMLRYIFRNTKIEIMVCANVKYTEEEKVTILKKFHDSKLGEAIKQTEETGANILHIVKSQTTVVKTAVKMIASSLNQTEALYKEISTKEQKLHERIMQLQNITDDVLDLLLAIRNIYHRILNKNTWVHAGDDTLTISCTDLPESFVQEVKVSGAITILDINCQVFTRDAVLTPIEDISSTNYKDFVPTTKIQNIFNKIPEHIHKYKLSDVWNNTSNIQLTDLHSVSRSLDEIQQMIDEEVIREQSQKHQFIHSNLLYVTIILATLSIILIIAIYILLKCRYVSNRQVIDIPRRLANYRSQIRNVRRGNFASEIYDEVPFSAPPSPPTAGVPKLSTTEHFHDTQPLILFDTCI
ncbi:hypothetical protein AGLY_003314 [Aphis glycines]|uniref:Uncharacterized protein n=1 Tax=Aphis glycines TaxID=307491 RepID=A0A6G0U0J1_APHGL|nr:hypothetical protein AGLY_003314 [Aphis glycines]